MTAVQSWIRLQTDQSVELSRLKNAFGFVALGIIISAALVRPAFALLLLIPVGVGAGTLLLALGMTALELLSAGKAVTLASCGRLLDKRWNTIPQPFRKFMVQMFIGWLLGIFLLLVAVAVIILMQVHY